jgi:hypothetical protein
MNKKIGVVVASTLFLIVVLSTPLAFAQPWQSCEMNVQVETVTVSESVGYFSFYAIPPRPDIPNTITVTGGGETYTRDLVPGDLVIVHGFLASNLQTSSDHLTYQGPADSVEINSAEIPEFPSFLILPLFMIATLLAAIVLRRKRTS